MKTTFNSFDSFFAAYLVAALWSSTDSSGDPLDKHRSTADIHPDCAAILKAHAFSFWARMWYCLDAEDPQPKGDVAKLAGHDFWLTSQGHGSGFWDGDWPNYGELLTKLSKCYPSEIEIWFNE